jgi:hypothetical protein
MTDERLIECSASATGVYIRIMCILHKSEPYGGILLKQNDKQNDKQILNFASKLLKFLPYNFDEILFSLQELLDNNVLKIDGDMLYQGRMLRDGKLSDIRAVTGSKGGKKTQKNIKKNTENFALNFAKAKTQANSDIDIDIDNDNDINNKIKEKKVKFNFSEQLIQYGARKEFVIEWLEIRRTKRLANTEGAFKRFMVQVQETGKDINQVLEICIDRSWGGFKNEWLKKSEKSKYGRLDEGAIQRYIATGAGG